MAVRDVSVREITEFLREHRRLVRLREHATYDEWLTYHEQKADLLQRIAAHPGTLVDPQEAKEAAAIARHQFESMLRHPSVIGGSRDT